MGFKGAKYGSWNTVVGKNYVGTGAEQVVVTQNGCPQKATTK